MNTSEDITRLDFSKTLDLYKETFEVYPKEQIDDNSNDSFLFIKNKGISFYDKPVKINHYLLSICLSGTNTRKINSKEIEIRPGSMLFLTPKQVITFPKNEEDVELIDILFTREFLLESRIPEDTLEMLLWVDPACNSFFNLNDQTFKKVEETCNKIERESNLSELFFKQIVRYSIIELLFRINRIEKDCLHDGKNPSMQGYAIYKEFKRLVSDNYKTKRDVNAYAELLYVSPKYLSEIVKKQSGKTALELIHQRVVTEAKNLLGFTNRPAKEIAYSLGFTNPSHFSRFFKRKTGVSPTTYRKNRSLEH